MDCKQTLEKKLWKINQNKKSCKAKTAATKKYCHVKKSHAHLDCSESEILANIYLSNWDKVNLHSRYLVKSNSNTTSE